MIGLYWIDRQGITKEKYQTFTNLKDFNRWSKKFLNMNFNKIIDTNDSEPYKIMMINFSLKFPSHLKIGLDKEQTQ